MNSDLIEASINLVLVIFVLFSIIRFSRFFYKNPDAGVKRIVLNRKTIWLFTMFFSLNFVFMIGFFIMLLPGFANLGPDLLAILVYLVGVAAFFFGMSVILSRKSKQI